MAEGWVLMGAGMGVVFAFLFLLVFVLSRTAAFFRRRDARAAEQERKD